MGIFGCRLFVGTCPIESTVTRTSRRKTRKADRWIFLVVLKNKILEKLYGSRTASCWRNEYNISLIFYELRDQYLQFCLVRWKMVVICEPNENMIDVLTNAEFARNDGIAALYFTMKRIGSGKGLTEDFLYVSNQDDRAPNRLYGILRMVVLDQIVVQRSFDVQPHIRKYFCQVAERGGESGSKLQRNRRAEIEKKLIFLLPQTGTILRA